MLFRCLLENTEYIDSMMPSRFERHSGSVVYPQVLSASSNQDGGFFTINVDKGLMICLWGYPNMSLGGGDSRYVRVMDDLYMFLSVDDVG